MFSHAAARNIRQNVSQTCSLNDGPGLTLPEFWFEFHGHCFIFSNRQHRRTVNASFAQLHLFASFFSTRGPRNRRVGENDERVRPATPLLGLPIGTGDFVVPRSSHDHSTRKARVRTAGQFRDRTRAVPSIRLGFNHDSAPSS